MVRYSTSVMWESGELEKKCKGKEKVEYTVNPKIPVL